MNNCLRLHNEVRKAAYRDGTGSGSTYLKVLCQALYSDVETSADALRKHTSLERWRRALELIGVARITPQFDDDGAIRCLRWELLELTSEQRRRSSGARAPLS